MNFCLNPQHDVEDVSRGKLEMIILNCVGLVRVARKDIELLRLKHNSDKLPMIQNNLKHILPAQDVASLWPAVPTDAQEDPPLQMAALAHVSLKIGVLFRGDELTDTDLKGLPVSFDDTSEHARLQAMNAQHAAHPAANVAAAPVAEPERKRPKLREISLSVDAMGQHKTIIQDVLNLALQSRSETMAVNKLMSRRSQGDKEQVAAAIRLSFKLFIDFSLGSVGRQEGTVTMAQPDGADLDFVIDKLSHVLRWDGKQKDKALEVLRQRNRRIPFVGGTFDNAVSICEHARR